VKQVGVQLPANADDVALPAFVRRTPPLLLSTGRAAIERQRLLSAPTAANLLLQVCCRGP